MRSPIRETNSAVLSAFSTAFHLIHEGGTTLALILQMRKQTQRVSEHLRDLGRKRWAASWDGAFSKAETIFCFIPSPPAAKTVFSSQVLYDHGAQQNRFRFLHQGNHFPSPVKPSNSSS